MHALIQMQLARSFFMVSDGHGDGHSGVELSRWSIHLVMSRRCIGTFSKQLPFIIYAFDIPPSSKHITDIPPSSMLRLCNNNISPDSLFSFLLS